MPVLRSFILSIGIFDSGIGGLTVFRAIAQKFPDSDLYYLGDTARVPYGNKSPSTIIRYSDECANYLVNEYNVDAIVIACNSASSHALDKLKSKLNIPVLGVINPGAQQAVKVTKSGKIGVAGTQATIKSKSYIYAINKFANKKMYIEQQACPLFVPVVEEGMINNEISRLVIKHYLDQIVSKGIDTLVLGCTHYPVLRETIQSIYPKINIVDSADVIIDHLITNNIPKKETGIRKINVTDESTSFENLKNMLVGDISTNLVSLNICE